MAFQCIANVNNGTLLQDAWIMLQMLLVCIRLNPAALAHLKSRAGIHNRNIRHRSISGHKRLD